MDGSHWCGCVPSVPSCFSCSTRGFRAQNSTRWRRQPQPCPSHGCRRLNAPWFGLDAARDHEVVNTAGKRFQSVCHNHLCSLTPARFGCPCNVALCLCILSIQIYQDLDPVSPFLLVHVASAFHWRRCTIRIYAPSLLSMAAKGLLAHNPIFIVIYSLYHSSPTHHPLCPISLAFTLPSF